MSVASSALLYSMFLPIESATKSIFGFDKYLDFLLRFLPGWPGAGGDDDCGAVAPEGEGAEVEGF